MEFEINGLTFSNELIPPQVRPYPKIINYAQFLKEFNKIKQNIYFYIIIERKYDGVNLRLVKWDGKIYVLTRNENARKRFFNLFKEALENNPYLIGQIQYFYENWGNGSYIVGELISGKLKAPYTPITQASNFIIFEYWDNDVKNFYPFQVNNYIWAINGGEIQEKLSPSWFKDGEGKETMKYLSWLAWIRDYEGFVIKAIGCDSEILLRGKIKPIHFNFSTHEQFFYKKGTKKKQKRNKENIATKVEVLEVINKIKLKLSEEEFLNPNIAMKEIAKEVKEEYNKILPKPAYRLYLSVVKEVV